MTPSLPPIADRYLEDYHPGAVYALGSVAVTEAEVLEFARRYDPQPIHIDRAAAEAGPYGGIISSGWLTVSLFMRLLAEGFLPGAASLGSPGVDQLRWLKPVRPGDVLTGRITVLEARRSRSKPDRGLIRSASEVINQNGETVMTLSSVGLMMARHPG